MKNKKESKKLHNMTLSAMFMAIGLVLPFLTGQIPQIGSALLPMHIPVMLCGLICGWQYGLFVGFALPLFRMALFGMPPVLTAIAMAFELAAYGAIMGYLYNRSKWQCVWSLYKSMLAAMVCGRLVWGAVRVIMTGVAGEAFTWKMFFAAALVNAIPGIILQLVLIPALMIALDKTGIVKFQRETQKITA